MHNNCNGHVNLQFAFSTSANLLKTCFKRTLLIGYYISDMGYKKKRGKFCAKTFMIIIGANFFIIKSEVQTFIGLIGCSYIFFSDVKKLISKLYLH